jgi:cytochrome c oxidase subunit 3
MPEPRPAFQYADLAQEHDAATIGMWVFLATEVLFFGGLITAYAVYRHMYPVGFAAAAGHTKILLGTSNTAVLLTSGLTMALGVEAAERGDGRAATGWLALSAALGVGFLGIKAYEYLGEIGEHLLPGAGFDFDPAYRNAAQLFYLLYFLLTGLHALHVALGVVAIAIVAAMAWRGSFSQQYATPVVLTGLYWGFVDVVWIFLYALIYLPGRRGS